MSSSFSQGPMFGGEKTDYRPVVLIDGERTRILPLDFARPILNLPGCQLGYRWKEVSEIEGIKIFTQSPI